MFKLDLEKAEEPEIKLPTSAGSSNKIKLEKKKKKKTNLKKKKKSKRGPENHLLLLY